MEDDLRSRECQVKRCYECNRLEEQLWNMAYEHIWPLVRRQLGRRQSPPIDAPPSQRDTVAKGA